MQKLMARKVAFLYLIYWKCRLKLHKSCSQRRTRYKNKATEGFLWKLAESAKSNKDNVY
jgi:hypothetical protein